MQEKKKTLLLLIPGDISVEKLMNAAHVGVNFYDKTNFKNNIIHKTKNGVDWIFSDNENKHKNFHRILDDDNELNTHNPFTMNKILYDNKNDNPLNDEEYNREDNIINS